MKISNLFSRKQKELPQSKLTSNNTDGTQQSNTITEKPKIKRKRYLMHRKICIVCLRPFTATRSDAMYCMCFACWG